MNPLHLLDRFRKPQKVLEVQSTGRNTTFVHQAGCQRPLRPCGCMPTFRTKGRFDPLLGEGVRLHPILQDVVGPLREFWVTPHPNRAMRRRAARAAQGRVVSKNPSKSRMHQS